MLKCCLVDTSYPINTRNQKIIDSLIQKFPNINISVITWDRRGIAPDNIPNYYFYKGNVQLGNRVKKFIYLPKYRNYIQQQLQQIQPQIIIASHWYSLFGVNSDTLHADCIIYENLDMPDGRLIVRLICQCIERHSLKCAHIISHASRFYLEKYSFCKQKQIVLENKPKFSKVLNYNTLHNPLVISFIGTIRYFDTLVNLIEAVQNNTHYELRFYGNGPDLDKLMAYCSKINNVVFFGTYNYGDVQQFYRESDIIWAVYPNKDYNVKYAISNKFFESMCLGVPCIYANNTKLGDYVSMNNIGYTVDPYNSRSIKELLDRIVNDKEHYELIKKNVSSYISNETDWDTDFNRLAEEIAKRITRL